MPLSPSTIEAMKERACQRAAALGLDPQALVVEGGERRIWHQICSDSIRLAGWDSSRDCPDSNGKALLLMIDIWEPSEFVYGGPTEEYKQ